MKVAIVGYDVEGQASYRYYASQNADITIFDEAEKPRATPPDGVKVVSGSGALEALMAGQYDVVMRTPGLAPHKLGHAGNVSTATKEFFRVCPAPIIGVTGTKGKGTTSSFIAEILKAAGETVHLVGNIGAPSLDALPNIKPQDVVVYELSSFQLWDMDDSPHVAVVLMIEADHLDVHATMGEYVHAKANICRWQKPTDTVVYYPHNQHSVRIANLSPGHKLGYTEPPATYVKDGRFFINEQELCSTATVVIPGNHNLDNACAAITAAWQFTRNKAAIAAGLSNFTGLPHRLKFVHEAAGVRYYDDSIATTPGSAIAAIKAFDQPKVLILGGSDKGSDYSELAATIKQHESSMRGVMCIGQTGPAIASLLKERGIKNVMQLGAGVPMQQIVTHAHETAQPGDIVILSPASASFDMFKSYVDRGEQFVKAVLNL